MANRYRSRRVPSRVNRPSNPALAKPDMQTIVVQFMDVKDMIYRFWREGKTSGDSNLDGYLRRGKSDMTTRQRGQGINGIHDFQYEDGGQKLYPSTNDALHWMDYGFVTREMMNTAERVPLGFETRPAWSDDEGDIDPGRMAAGYDDFFLGRTEQRSKPGLNLRFDMWFSAGVPNITIAEYGRWLMQLIAGIESMGFDLTIDAYSVTGSTFADDSMSSTDNMTAIAIRVKNQSESNDMTTYSCLFSPIGTRILTFTAMATAAQKIGKKVSSWFGTAVQGRNWDLTYDHDTNVVTVNAAQTAVWNQGSAFPAKELTQKAVDAGLIPAQ